MSLKLAVKIRKVTVTAFHCEESTHPQVKAAKGLKRWRAKVKGVNNAAWKPVERNVKAESSVSKGLAQLQTMT